MAYASLAIVGEGPNVEYNFLCDCLSLLAQFLAELAISEVFKANLRYFLELHA